MSAEGCPCGYHDLGVRKWSKEWHRRHMAAHLVAFPDVDQRKEPQEVIVATGRAEDEPCEAGTIGCCVAHEAMGIESSCETW